MNRLTKDDVKQMGMVDLAHNQVFIKDGEAWYRDFEREISIRELAREMLLRHGYECSTDMEEFDWEMMYLLEDGYEFDTLDGIIALLYRAWWSMADIRERLKKYEDLEEQGLLIRLPCKVEDEVIIVFDDRGELFITDGWRVTEITITDNDVIFDFKCYETNDEEERSLKDFGKTVFLTREEAEKALEDKANE